MPVIISAKPTQPIHEIVSGSFVKKVSKRSFSNGDTALIFISVLSFEVEPIFSMWGKQL